MNVVTQPLLCEKWQLCSVVFSLMDLVCYVCVVVVEQRQALRCDEWLVVNACSYAASPLLYNSKTKKLFR